MLSTPHAPQNRLEEEAQYLAGTSSFLYTVLHRAKEPIARMLLVGPLPSERHYSYVPWISWARFMARRGVEVLRYDHRGIGESEGNFAETHFEDWSNDVVFLAERLAQMAPGLPLILHGLEIGAILAAQAFHKGLGDLLILWAPPASAHQSLRAGLLRWVALEQLSHAAGERKPASAVIRQLEEGASFEVAGYTWTSRFWLDSFATRMPDAVLENGSQQKTTMRPVKVFELGKESAPLVKAGYMAEEERKDFSSLFASNYEWLQNRLRAEVPA